VFTFASVGFKLVLGMVMALVLTSRIRYRNLFTGLLLIPWVAPTVVSALNFLWIFDASLGVPELSPGEGLPHPAAGRRLAQRARHPRMASVIFVNIWRGFPFFGISFLAGLKAIPGEQYEAAAVDGANIVQRFPPRDVAGAPQHHHHRDAAVDDLDPSTTSRSSTS